MDNKIDNKKDNRVVTVPNSSEKELKETAQNWKEEARQEIEIWKTFLDKIQRRK